MYVGIDASWTGLSIVKLGLAGDPADFPYVENLSTKPKDFPSKMSRLDHIVQCVMASMPPPTMLEGAVAIEGYSFGSHAGREMAGELGGAIRMVLYCAGLPYFDVPPTTLKAFVTGKGNADKNIVMMEVYKRWGFEAKNDNEADAYALAHLTRLYSRGAAHWPKTFEKTAAKIEVIQGRE